MLGTPWTAAVEIHSDGAGCSFGWCRATAQPREWPERWPP